MNLNFGILATTLSAHRLLASAGGHNSFRQQDRHVVRTSLPVQAGFQFNPVMWFGPVLVGKINNHNTTRKLPVSRKSLSHCSCRYQVISMSGKEWESLSSPIFGSSTNTLLFLQVCRCVCLLFISQNDKICKNATRHAGLGFSHRVGSSFFFFLIFKPGVFRYPLNLVGQGFFFGSFFNCMVHAN